MPDWPFEMYEKVKLEEAMKWLGQPGPPVAKQLRDRGRDGGMDSRWRHEEPGRGTGSRQGDCEGGRTPRMAEETMTAMEARTLWLEREMGMLKRVMERETSLQRRLRSGYWQQEVQREERLHSRVDDQEGFPPSSFRDGEWVEGHGENVLKLGLT